MAIITAAAVTQERIYAASGFVEDDYIRDDKQPTATSMIGSGLVLLGGHLAEATSTQLTAGNYTVSPGYLSASVANMLTSANFIINLASVTSATAEMDCPGRLKWNLKGGIPTEWDDEDITSVTWEDDAPVTSTFTRRQAQSSTWNKVEITEESPFG